MANSGKVYSEDVGFSKCTTLCFFAAWSFSPWMVLPTVELRKHGTTHPQSKTRWNALLWKNSESFQSPKVGNTWVKHSCSCRNQYSTFVSFWRMQQFYFDWVACVEHMIVCVDPRLASNCERSDLITSGDCDMETYWGLENENVSTLLLFILKNKSRKGLK
jgi:hypothetical protein